MSTTKPAALSYAARGWPVLPLHWWQDGACSCGDPACRTPAKHPLSHLVPNGLHNASTDAATVGRWWTREPRANIGVRTGPESGLLVIDVDVRDNKDGGATLTSLATTLGPLPATVEAITGSGSRHLLFTAPSGPTRAGLGEGVDVKCAGGYIVVAPSNHASGREYAWNLDNHPDDMAPAALPPAWLAALQAPIALVLSTPNPNSLSPHTVAKVRSAVGVLSPGDYDTWVGVGMALHHEGGGSDQAFGLWWEWSASWESSNAASKKVQLKELRSRWAGFGKSGAEPRTFGWLWRVAGSAGWVPPAPPVPTITSAPPDAWSDAWAHNAPGVLGTITRWSLATAPCPVPLYSLAAALAIGSVCAGRHYTLSGTYSPLYLLVAGRTASGKEWVKRTIVDTLAPIAPHLIGPGDFSSESAVLSTLRDRPQFVAVLDEFGQQLAAAKGPGTHHRQGAMRQLMEAWGAAGGMLLGKALSTLGLKPQDAPPPVTIIRPCLVAVGLTTPERLHNALESAHVGDGFLNRWLLLEHDQPRVVPQPRAVPPVPDSVTEWVRAMLTPPSDLPALTGSAPPPWDVPATDEARALLDAVTADATGRANTLDTTTPGAGGLWGRAAEQVRRLTLIAALADAGSPREAVADVQHVAWARGVVWWCMGRMVTTAQDRIGDSPFERARSKALAAITTAGADGLTRRDLMRGPLRAFSTRDVDAVVDALREAGQVVVGHSGRKSTPHYWAGDESAA